MTAPLGGSVTASTVSFSSIITESLLPYIYSSNAGIYMFKKELVSKIPKNKFFDITDLMNILLLEEKKILHDPIRGYWIDIGKPSDYQNAKEFVKHLGF